VIQRPGKKEVLAGGGRLEKNPQRGELEERGKLVGWISEKRLGSRQRGGETFVQEGKDRQADPRTYIFYRKLMSKAETEY